MSATSSSNNHRRNSIESGSSGSQKKEKSKKRGGGGGGGSNIERKTLSLEEDGSSDCAWVCLKVATEIGKFIDSIDGAHSGVNVDLEELKSTLATTRSVIVPFINNAKNLPAYDLCIESLRKALVGCSSTIENLEAILCCRDLSCKKNLGELEQSKVILYRYDFQIKLSTDQFSALFPSPNEGPAKIQTIIEDSQGKAFWATAFHSSMMVPWEKFFRHLQSFLNLKLSGEDEPRIKYFVAFTDNGFVTPFEFSMFLKWFGPLAGCTKRVLRPLNAGFLTGFIPAIEAHQLLSSPSIKQVGCFLVRFSKTRAGAFALTFIDSHKHIKHCLLFRQKGGITLRNPPDLYDDLCEFINAHKTRLRTPLNYFDGDRIQAERKQQQQQQNTSHQQLIDDASSSDSSSSPPPSSSSSCGGDTSSADSSCKKDEQFRTCVVCLDGPVQTVFLECGHLCCCKECSKPLKQCPMCRAPITRVIPIFPV